MFDVKQLQKMQKELSERMTKAQDDLKTKSVEGTSGGGIVTAMVNGAQELVSVKIKPEAIDPEDPEMLEDLVVVAVNNALVKAKDLNQDEMSKITGGIKIPGLF
jgi:DNA-binding YbaB/EbfC family protein